MTPAFPAQPSPAPGVAGRNVTNPAPDVDLGFRPDYWNAPGALEAILVNIKGARRREMIRDFVSGVFAAQVKQHDVVDTLVQTGLASADEAESLALALRTEVHPDLLASELEDPSELGHIDPTFLGGEFLPPYLPGEVEIARLTLESTTMDVYSVRARRRSRIYYRVVDEYESPWRFRPRSSRRPLTLGQMVGFIDSLEINGQEHPGKDFLTWFHDFDLESEQPTDSRGIEAIARFITVSSDFYPGLEAYYRWRNDEWLRRQLAAREVR